MTVAVTNSINLGLGRFIGVRYAVVRKQACKSTSTRKVCLRGKEFRVYALFPLVAGSWSRWLCGCCPHREDGE